MGRSRVEWLALGLVAVVLVVGGVGIATDFTARISPTVYAGTSTGPVVGIGEGSQAKLDTFTPNSSSARIETDVGNLTAVSTGTVRFRVDDFEGTFTNVSQIQLQGNEVKIDPDDKPPVNLSGNPLDTFDWRDPTLDDGSADFAYSGSGGDVTVAVYGVPANTQIAAVNQSGKLLDGAQSDGSGVVRFTSLPTSSHTVSMKSVDSTTPELSDPKPQGPQSDFPTTTSVKVNDGDFPNDNVTVEFYRRVKGSGNSFSKVGSDYVTSDGTRASTSMPKPGRNVYEMRASATDGFGNTVNLTWTFSTPRNLTLRNETTPTQKIDCSAVDIQFKFYQDASGNDVLIAQRDCTNSLVDMTGLPTDPYTVTFRPNTSYYDRELYVESIARNQTGFLLNKTAYPNAKTIEFELDDRTGNFNVEESTIRIQRAINTTSTDPATLTWTTVAGDQFDATGSYFFTGQTGARYRVIVENRQGDRRVLGPYTIVESRVETLVLGKVGWPQLNGTTTWFRASVNQTSALGKTPPVISVAYFDPANNTDNLKVQVYERGNESNLLYSDSVNGSFGKYYTEVNVTEDQAENTTWIVELNYQHKGETVTQKRIVGAKTPDLPIDKTLLSGAFLVFVPMAIVLYGPRTWQYGLTIVGVLTGIGMFLQLVVIAVPAYVVYWVIVAAGILRTEATNTPT